MVNPPILAHNRKTGSAIIRQIPPSNFNTKVSARKMSITAHGANKLYTTFVDHFLGARAAVKAPIHIGPSTIKANDAIPAAREERSSRKNALRTNP